MMKPENYHGKNMNKNVLLRDQILAPYFTDKTYLGGVRSFAKLSSKIAQELLTHKFADPEDRQNDSPTFIEFVEFMCGHPEFKAHGYAVSKERPDYRITIEGLEAKNPSAQASTKFKSFCKNADDLSNKYSWYD